MKHRLSKRAFLFLRLIAAAQHGIWRPKERWRDEEIRDGSGDFIPNIGGGADARILQSLVDKQLVMKLNGSLGWWSLSVTPEGAALVKACVTGKREVEP